MNYKQLIIIILSLTLLAIAAVIGSSFLYTPQQVKSSGFDEIPMTGHMWSSNTGWISLKGPDYGLTLEMTEVFDDDSDYAAVYKEGRAKTSGGGRYGWAGADYLGWLDFYPADPVDPELQATTIPGERFQYTSGGGDQEGYFEGSAQFVAGKEDYDGWDGWLKFDGDADDGNPSNDPDGSYQVKRDYCDFTGHAWGDMSVGWVSVNQDQSSGYYAGGYNPDYRMGFANSVTSCEKPEINFDTFQINGKTLHDGEACQESPIDVNDPDASCTIDMTTELELSWKHENEVKPQDIANVTIELYKKNKNDPDELVETRVWEPPDNTHNPIENTTDNLSWSIGGDRLIYTYSESQFPNFRKLSNDDAIYFVVESTNKFGDTHDINTDNEIDFETTLEADLAVTCEVVERIDDTFDYKGDEVYEYRSAGGGVTTDINNLIDIRISFTNAFVEDLYVMSEGEFYNTDTEGSWVTYDGQEAYREAVKDPNRYDKSQGMENPTSGADGGVITYHPNDSSGDPDYPSGNAKDYIITYEGVAESDSIILQNVRVGEVNSDVEEEISNYIGELGLEIIGRNADNATNDALAECPDIVNFGKRSFDQVN